jgi:subtilisin family serine protease
MNDPLQLVELVRLMKLTSGRPEITIGLIDGPVAMDHPNLASENFRIVPPFKLASCPIAASAACVHGTLVAGILAARRGSQAPAICPDCTLLLRPIFAEAALSNHGMPSATPEQLAAAIVSTVDAGARILNLSVAVPGPSLRGMRQLEQSLDYAAARGTLTVVAAGNQGTIGGSPLTRHSWVIPVAGCDLQARPVPESNLGQFIGARGLSAPAEDITSLGVAGKPITIGGTSAAVPFVTGALALLWSEFPGASAAQMRLAITHRLSGHPSRRATIVPPLLNAWAAYEFLRAANKSQGRVAS